MESNFVGASPKLASTPRRFQRLGVLGLPIPDPSIPTRSPYLIHSRRLDINTPTETSSTVNVEKEETVPVPPSLDPELTIKQLFSELNSLRCELRALYQKHETETNSMKLEIESLRLHQTSPISLPPTLPSSDVHLATTSVHLATTSVLLPTTSVRLPTTSVRLPTTSVRLPTTSV